MISAGRVLANSSFRLKIEGLSAYPTKKGEGNVGSVHG
jgi:hypothetical protein